MVLFSGCVRIRRCACFGCGIGRVLLGRWGGYFRFLRVFFLLAFICILDSFQSVPVLLVIEWLTVFLVGRPGWPREFVWTLSGGFGTGAVGLLSPGGVR